MRIPAPTAITTMSAPTSAKRIFWKRVMRASLLDRLVRGVIHRGEDGGGEHESGDDRVEPGDLRDGLSGVDGHADRGEEGKHASYGSADDGLRGGGLLGCGVGHSVLLRVRAGGWAVCSMPR